MPKVVRAEEKKDEAAEPKKQARETVSSLEVPTYYCNTLDATASSLDFRVRLGEVLDVTPERIQIKHLATVYFSPRHMKAVTKLLQDQLRIYEEKNGKIPD